MIPLLLAFIIIFILNKNNGMEISIFTVLKNKIGLALFAILFTITYGTSLIVKEVSNFGYLYKVLSSERYSISYKDDNGYLTINGKYVKPNRELYESDIPRYIVYYDVIYVESNTLSRILFFHNEKKRIIHRIRYQENIGVYYVDPMFKKESDILILK